MLLSNGLCGLGIRVMVGKMKKLTVVCDTFMFEVVYYISERQDVGNVY